jgi:putative membrane protein
LIPPASTRFCIERVNLMREGLMKTFTTVRCLGLIACLAVTPQLSFAQEPPPPTKLPPQPRGNPPADPRLPTEANPVPKGNDGGTGDQKPLKAPAEADTRFALTAAEGGMLEVELGRMASAKASNAEVKEFAAKMVTDHSKANAELTEIASTKNLALPTQEQVKAKHQAMIAKLEKLEGAAFDREYMTAMVKDHDKDVALFEKQAKNGRDAALQAFAAKALPTLREHQKMAKQVSAKVAPGTE